MLNDLLTECRGGITMVPLRHAYGLSHNRLLACRCAVRLGADRGAVWQARPPDRLARRRAEPRHRIAEIAGPEAGLRIVDQLSPSLGDFRYLYSTKAELLRRQGRIDEAREAYLRAKLLTHDGTERRFLERRLTELASATHSA